MQDPDLSTNRGAAEPYRPDRGLAPTNLLDQHNLPHPPDPSPTQPEPALPDMEETIAEYKDLRLVPETCGPTRHGFECTQPAGHNTGRADTPSNHTPDGGWGSDAVARAEQETFDANPPVNHSYRMSHIDAASLRKWWVANAENEAPEIARKAATYGSNSLAAMGHMFARAQGRTVPHAEALEIGSLVYLYGKVERMMDAVYRGQPPGEDSVRDASVYARMILRIRETGDWP